MFKHKFTIASLFILMSNFSLAQDKVVISGFIKEDISKERIPGAIIRIDNSDFIINTNDYGFFSIETNPGKHTIIINNMSHNDTAFDIDIQNSTKIDIFLTKRKDMLEEVVITKNLSQAKDSRMGNHHLSVEQIKDVPSMLGEKDVFKVIKLLPGVQKGQEGSSGFNVRGGTADQNLIMLDDAVVYNANHLFGFFSTFNGDAIKSVELIKGGYPAKYGERLSSVLNMTMKDGNKQKYTGEFGIGILSARGVIEGPIIKDKSSFMVSARRSYIDVLMQPFIKAQGADNTGFYFHDVNAKVNYEINENNTLYLSTYIGRDQLYYKEKFNDNTSNMRFGWGNQFVSIRWNHIFNPKLFSNVSLIFSEYNLKTKLSEKNGSKEEYSLQFLSSIQDIGAKIDFTYFANNQHNIKFGFKTTQHIFKPNILSIKENQILDTTNHNDKKYYSLENNIYIDDEWKITPNMAGNIGLRGSSFTSNDKTYFNIEPRLSLRYLFNNDLSIKAGYTIMNQYMHLLSSTGISLPTDMWVPATEKIGPQRAIQYSLGLFKDFKNNDYQVSLEGWYKDMQKIVSYKEGTSFMDIGDPFNTDPNTSYENSLTSGMGRSYGAELMIQKKNGKFTGWLSYTLGWTEYQFSDINNGNWYFPIFDRRHDLNIVGFYEINKNIKLNALFTIATGNPITLPRYNASSPHISADGSINNGGYQNQYDIPGGRNDYRAEVYHRLDIGIQFMKQKKRGTRTWEISIYNVYNRMNPFFYTTHKGDVDVTLNKVTIFPIIPSISYSFKFN